MALRPYREADLEACIAIVDEVWSFRRRLQPAALAEHALRFYVGASLAGSDCGWVVEDGAGVRGFLLGRSGAGARHATSYGGGRGTLHALLGRLRALLGRLRALLSTLRAVLGLLRLRGLPLREKLDWLAAVRAHEAERARIEPAADGEVTLFAVAAAARGRGFGRALMQAYLEHCRHAGTRRILVETDRDSSFGFYDGAGFQRVGSFRSRLNERFSGVTDEAFLYQLDL